MISGQETLDSIDTAIQKMRGKIADAENLLEERSSRILTLGQEEFSQYRELARLRVKLLVADQMTTFPDEADTTVQGLLNRRQAELDELQQDVLLVQQLREALKKKRKVQAETVNKAAEAVDDAEKKTQDRLHTDPAYNKQFETTKEAERTLLHAREKADQWEKEHESKSKPYREDPLFMYLWDRGFGTTTYQAGSLTRWLDSKVAALIRFAEARVNYGKLQEIPQRLREHANQVQKEAEHEFAALKALDERAKEEDGILPLEQTLTKEEESLKAIDQELQENQAKRQELEKLQMEYAAGQDKLYLQAVDFLSNAMRREDLQRLRSKALATPFPEDDLIIARLLGLEAEERELNNAIRELQNSILNQQKRLKELENLRWEFKRNRYDRAGTVFSDPAVIYTMLGNLINGVLTSEAFWRMLKQQRQYRQRRADPGFGSGGFGRGTIWGSGMRFPGRSSGGVFGNGGSGGFRFPGGRGGGKSSGGFRTGGGF